MDIFKNVQNEKLPTNLDRPFFWDPIFGIYAIKKIKNKTNLLTYYKSYKIYLINNGYNIGDDDGNIVTMAWLIF